MIIFIDESGIHRKDGKSLVALVYVVVNNLENIEQSIERTEESLKISSFHWPRHIWKIRNKFLIPLLKENFEVKVSIIDNPFNQKVFEESLTYLITERKIDKIIIDGKKPKWYVLRLKKVLREKGISVKKIRFGNDKSYPCLRLADVYAGLLSTYFNDQKNEKAKELYELANKKITTLAGGQATE